MMAEDSKERGHRTMSRRTFLLGGLAAAGALTTADAFWLEPRGFVVEELSLPLAKLPPGRELRLVQLSDLHLRRLDNYARRVAEAANALAPEAILVTGDFLERARNIRGLLEFLKLLRAPQGVWGVQGNWEYWARVEGENLRRHLAGAGVGLLIDERRDLELQGVPLSLLGLDYPSPADHLRKLQESADPRRVNLLLSHVPAFDHDLLDGRIDLILSGHTHGGQVRLPFLTPPVLPRFSANFIAGLYRVGHAPTPLYVNRGIGTSILPVRFCSRPEITLIRLHAA